MSTSFWGRRLNKKMKNAIYWRRESELRELLDRGADANAAPGHKENPLSQAIYENFTPNIALLLSRGALPDPAEEGTGSLLLAALDKKNFDAAWLLVEAGADLSKRGSDGATPLLLAASLEAGDLVELMLANGADVNARTKRGDTALHIVAAAGHGNIARVLLDHGADRQAKDGSLNTPADVADRKYPRLADMLRDGAPVKSAAAPLTIVTGTSPVQAPMLLEPATAETPADGAVDPEGAAWRLTAANEVALVLDRPAIGYRLTEIFNFKSGIYTRLARSLETGAESQSTRFFDEFPDRAPLDQARAALVRLGGNAADGVGVKTLDKPATPQLSARGGPAGGPA